MSDGQALLPLPGLVAAEQVPSGPDTARRKKRRVPNVSKRAARRVEAWSREVPAVAKGSAILGFLRWGSAEGRCGKGLHIVNHIYPYWRVDQAATVTELEQLIEVWCSLRRKKIHLKGGIVA